MHRRRKLFHLGGGGKGAKPARPTSILNDRFCPFCPGSGSIESEVHFLLISMLILEGGIYVNM